MARRHVVIIGAGVTGLSLAAELGRTGRLAVTVLDSGAPGSTASAPGLVGLHHDVPVLAELARLSADRYEALPGDGFSRVGGLEVATSPAGMAAIERRATSAGQQARLLTAAETTALAPRLVDRCVGAAVFARDGTAETSRLTEALRREAAGHGVYFLPEVPVRRIGVDAGRVRTVQGIPATDAVIACGVRAPSVAALAGFDLPLTPVAHPYVYGPGPGTGPAPFVRWPEHQVYARHHGDRLGLGTDDHVPLPLDDLDDLDGRAGWDWPADPFDGAVSRAMRLLPEAGRFTPASRVTGVYARTADHLPLLGPAPQIEGLWLAAALRVTHAAGAAAVLARMMTGAAPTVGGLDLLRPDRFAGQDPAALRSRALTYYRDVDAADT